MTRITTSTSVGLNLNPALYKNPVVIDRGVTISNPFYPSAVYSDPSYPVAFVIRNRGVITGGSAGVGIDLTAGGSVFNERRAHISGYTAIEISGTAGQVLNYGTIVGLDRIGIDLQAGGYVGNDTRGLITGPTAVDINGPAAVVNYGTILGSGGGPSSGIDLQSGGYIGNAPGASIIGDGNYGILMSGSGTVVNFGSIAGAGFGGVVFGAGGTLINRGGGSITGYYRGVESDGPGTVINYGNVTATARSCEGVLLALYTPGLVINNPGGSITGFIGIDISGGAQTFLNSGYVGGRFSGAQVGFGAVGINDIGGTIVGASIGVTMPEGGTLVDKGTVIGSSGTALNGYDVNGHDLLVLYPTFEFSGLVVGDKYTSNTLELASAASTGTVTGLGSEIVHFGSIIFDPGAQWSVAGLARAFDGPISGFAAGDSMDLTGLAANSYTYSGGKLTLLENGKPVQSITISTPYSASHFYVNPDGSGGTLLTVAPAGGANTFTFDDVSQASHAGINLQAYPSGSTATTVPPYPSNPVLAANPVPAASLALPQSYPHAGLIPPS
jgi:hypothetical protein